MLPQSWQWGAAVLKPLGAGPLIKWDYMYLRAGFVTRVLPLLLAALAWLPSGCGESSQTQDVTGFEDVPAEEQKPRDQSNFQLGGCEDGETRNCSVTLSEHDGVLSCYYGTQLCAGGKWGPCGNGEIKETPVPEPVESTTQLQSLSNAAACENNPCDPYCRTFEEEPESPYEVEDATPIYTWEEGSLSEFPSGLVKKGLQQPCDSSGDCQFNRRCKDPVNGSCAHDVCSAGDALAPGCNDCVDLVCAKDATCCSDPKGKSGGKVDGVADLDVSSCSHSPCSVGRGLVSTCNTCVKDVCAANPNCCNSGEWWNDNWSSECVAAVAEVCGNTCGCADGQVEHNGSCYAYQSTTRNWEDAVEECEDISGGGWSLVSIADSAENEVVSKIQPTKEKYIGFEEDSGTWTWVDGSSGSWDEWNGSGSLWVSWATSQPSPTTGDDVDCAYMNSNSTKWTGEKACSSNSKKRNSVCEGPTTVMKAGEGASVGPREWDAGCVALADSVCGLDCKGEPSDGSGVCTPWFPGETDPSCPGVDLAVSVPCDGVLPVCNHGNTTALPPIEVMHFPANSQQMPTCTPELSHPNMVTCVLDEPIAPGECVSVDTDDCTNKSGVKTPFSGNREIMINAAGKLINTGSGPATECDCLNNWSLYSHGASECGAPSCSGGSSAAKQTTKPVDIIIIIDNSPSMDDEIEEVQARIHEDLAKILEESKLDYRVIMISRFGDVDVPVGTSSTPICIGAPLGANTCTNPSTEKLKLNAPKFYHFSADIESWDSWCQMLHGFDHKDEVGVNDLAAGFVTVPAARAWTALAPSGWQEWLREEAFKTFLVITDDDVECDDYGYSFDDTPGCDGFPHNCHDLSTQKSYSSTVSAGTSAAAKFDAELLKLSPKHFGTAAKRNYVWHSIINIKNNPDGATTPWPASADIQRDMCTAKNTQIVGAGTGYQALSKLTGGLRYPICQKQNFNAIFNEIAKAVVQTSAASCEFTLPEGDDSDPNKAKVAYTTGTGASVTMSRVSGETSCGTSTTGWYYDDPDEPSQLTLCPKACEVVKADAGAQVWVELACPGSEQPATFTHEYQANCPFGHLPQWTFMGYDTTTVSDGSVSFRARTANTAEELGAATWHDLKTATAAAPDCLVAPPSTGCPVDLYTALGKADAKKWFLQLEFTINPSKENTSPSVEDWSVNFSCPPGE